MAILSTSCLHTYNFSHLHFPHTHNFLSLPRVLWWGKISANSACIYAFSALPKLTGSYADRLSFMNFSQQLEFECSALVCSVGGNWNSILISTVFTFTCRAHLWLFSVVWEMWELQTYNRTAASASEWNQPNPNREFQFHSCGFAWSPRYGWINDDRTLLGVFAWERLDRSNESTEFKL